MNITLPRAVIEQALEALDYVMRHGPAVQKAKDLLRTALEQPAPFVLSGINCSCGRKWRITNNTLTASEPTQQEPVAHQDTADKCLLETVPAKGTLFHTAPLQRKPLSDDEIQTIWEKAFESGSSPNAFARAIEAAHSRQDDYELLGYVELGGYFGIEQARKNGLSGVPVAIYVEPLLPEPNNDLTQMVPIYIKPEKEKPTT